jgi:hypothetical protein
MDFPLGWPVISAANVRRIRPLTGGATALVQVGEQVRPDQPIAERPGPDGARTAVPAGLAGRVAQVVPGRGVVIEGAAAVVQGILGVGGDAVGPLHLLPRGESVAMVRLVPGSVIVFPGQVPLTLLQRAASSRVAGIIGASVGARELEAFARADLSAALDGLVPEVARLPLTLVVTEGIGNWTMDPTTYQALSAHVGDIALLDGATNPRRNRRPEVLLALPLGTATVSTPADDNIVIGALVRLTAGQQRGASGEVVNVFAHRQVVAPGLLVRAVRLRLDDGTSPVVPINCVERVG